MKISHLFIYPVKSLGGMEVSEAEIDELGLVGDRRFMVVDDQGVFLTQRGLPRMALVRAQLRSDSLELSVGPHGGGPSMEGRAPSRPKPIQIHRATDPRAELVTVSVWKSRGLQAEDCGLEVAEWLSGFLRHECRLVRIGPKFRRGVGGSESDLVSFADGQPALILSEASLDLLNQKLSGSAEREQGDPNSPRSRSALRWDRFRPNIVVSGCGPHEEDTWKRIQIGETTWRGDGPCSRCVITTTDQETAVRGKEPLQTLATYRRDPDDASQVNFGQNLINETKRGRIRVGDPVVGRPLLDSRADA